MAKVRFGIDDGPADAAEVAAACAQASRAIGRQTRLINGTAARKRIGRHVALNEGEKAIRRAKRNAAADKRKLKQETFEELAKIRRARRLARQEEEERARRPRKLRAAIEHDRRTRATAAGGASLARSHERIEKVMVPFLPKASRLRETFLVFRIKSRSLGGAGLSRWRQGELARFGRYLVRLTGLEAAPEACVFTNLTEERPGTDAFVREMVDLLTAYEAFEKAVSPTGMVHKSIILPLPHEVGLGGRQEIARCVGESLSERNIPHLVVLHGPDPGGDARNYHLHVLALLRETEKVGELEWEIATTKQRDVFHPAMVKAWRRYIVALFNRELGRVRSGRRYTLDRAASPEAHRGRTKTADIRRAKEDLERRLDRERRHEAVARAIANAAASCAKLAERLDQVEQALNKTVARALVDMRASLEATRARVGVAAARINDALMPELVAVRAQLADAQDSLSRHTERVAFLVKETGREKSPEPKELGRALLDAERARRQLEDYVAGHDDPSDGNVGVSSGPGILHRLKELAAQFLSFTSKAIARGRARVGDLLVSWRERRAVDDLGTERVPVHEPLEVEVTADDQSPFAAFDAAYAEMAEASRDALAFALAHLRIALREERLHLRKTKAGWSVATDDLHAREVVRTLAATQAGDRILSKVASEEAAPSDWQQETIDRVAGVQHDWFVSAPHEMARVIEDQPVSARNLLVEKAIAPERGHGVEDKSLDILRHALEADRMTFCVSLNGIKDGERFDIASEDARVRAELETLASKPTGRTLLRILARVDIVGDIPALDHWSQARVITDTFHEDGAAMSPSEWIRKRKQAIEDRARARDKSRPAAQAPQRSPGASIPPPARPRDDGYER